jgi:hypothetical protein
MGDAKLTAEREAEIRAADAWHGEDIGRHGLGPPIHHRRELLAEIDRLRAAEAAARADERARFAPLLEACQPQLKDSAGSFYERVQRALRELERGEHIAGEGGGHG